MESDLDIETPRLRARIGRLLGTLSPLDRVAEGKKTPTGDLRYRPEVDGLRAVALVPAVMFHAGFAAFSGGFIGVDMFFVISGYLITTIIMGEIERGTFSIVRFYERRVRRILPALFFVMITCLPFAWMWMYPQELETFASSVVGVNLFFSNIVFLNQTGYFEAAGELKPLLHTWSLAVEEQFYIIFPMLLLLLYRFARKFLFSAVVLITVASLGYAEWMSRADPDANYYLLTTRAWELGVGAMLALTATRWPKNHGGLAQSAAIFGIAMIGYSVFAFDAGTPFPSLWTLVPVLGTALVIVFAGPTTLVNRFLCFGPVVALGIVSYSVYLWHMPLFAFARIRLIGDVSDNLFLLLALLSVVLSLFSWRYVEQPFRNRKRTSRSQVFTWAAVLSVCLVAVGSVGYFSSGFLGWHGSRDFADIEHRLRPNRGLDDTCNGSVSSPKCTTSDAPRIVLWGDSIAMPLAGAIMSSYPDAAVIQMTKSACGPVLGVAPVSTVRRRYNEDWAKRCIAFNEHVRTYIEETESVEFVVLSSAFTQFVRRRNRILVDGAFLEDDGSKPDLLLERFNATLDWVKQTGAEPIVVAPPPTNGRDLGNCLARTTWFGADSSQCEIDAADYQRRNLVVKAFLNEVGRTSRLVDMSDFLCDRTRCRVKADDVFIYRDGDHLSHEGSGYIGRNMDFYRLITEPKT